MPYGSGSDSGWQPGKNKTILTQKTKSNSPARKAAASFARSPGSTRSSGYGSDVPTGPRKGKGNGPKDGTGPRHNMSAATAASFTGKPYAGGGTSTPPPPAAAKRAAARAVAVRSPSEPKKAEKASNIGEKMRTRNFKGKYFGPDEFKGDMAKLRKWKAAGKKRNSDGSPKV